MKKTLQDQYLLIKEGKGHKDVFMKEAKHKFPNLIRNAATFNEVVATLKDKSLISENIVGLEAINSFQDSSKQSFEVAFSNFLKESQEEEEKAELKKPSKQVDDNLSHGFDTSDRTNPDNLIFDQIMKGYYAEMCDPKNEGKTMGELKSIVFKNLEKNPIYYTEDGQFGVKGLGYQTEAPGLGTPKEAKGKYKASGYGDLKESIGRNYPGELEGEYEGELQKIYGVDIYDTLKDVLDISDSEDDFIRKMTNSLTDETSILPKSSKDSGVYLLFKDNKLENIMFTDGMKPDDKLANSLKSSGYEVLFTSDSRFSTPNSISKYKNKNKEELELTKSRPSTEEKLRTWYQSNYNESLKESKLRKMIREMVDKELTELDSNSPDYYISIIASNQMSKDDAYDYLEDQGVEQNMIDSIIASAFPTDINESKLRKVIRESIEKELATINKEAEMEILDSKLEKIQSAIEKRQSQLTKLDEDEDMKALTDKTKVKQIQKDIKALEKAKSKIEKQLSKKDKPAKSEIIDEDEPIEEAIDDKKLDNTTKSLDDINKKVEDISKKTTEMFENEEDLPQDILNQVVEKFADMRGDRDSIPAIAASFPNYEEEIIEFLDGYDLGLDYDI
jgi:hypothetical protein